MFAWRYDTLLDKLEYRKGNLCLDCYALYWFDTGKTTKEELIGSGEYSEVKSPNKEKGFKKLNTALNRKSFIERVNISARSNQRTNTSGQLGKIQPIYLTDYEVVNHDKVRWQEAYDDFMANINTSIESLISYD